MISSVGSAICGPSPNEHPEKRSADSGSYDSIHFFDQLADGFELRAVGGLGPFEQHRFRGRDDGAGPFEAAEGEFPVDLVPGGDGVGGDLHLKPEVEQLEGGLGHADVGLDARDRDVADVPAVELFEKLGRLRSSETSSWPADPVSARRWRPWSGRGLADTARSPRSEDSAASRPGSSATRFATTRSWSGIRFRSLSCMSTARSAA